MGELAQLRKLFGAPGVRPVSGDALTVMTKRMPPLPKSQVVDELMAVDPVQAVVSRYIDYRGDEALARAVRLQGSDPIQFLEEGRFYDNPAAGVRGHEIPLATYPGERIPGRRGDVGLFRSMPGRASIQVAEGAPYPFDTLLEEARHAIDRQLVPGVPARSFNAPSAFAALLQYEPHGRAQSLMRYFADPAETRATLSGLLADTDRFIDTPSQAAELLERAQYMGSLREQATAEGILNSKALRNEYIPYLLKALSAGGVAAGINSQENQ